MRRALVIQLPVPQNSFGRQTGNIPLAGACLRQAVQHLRGIDIQIMPESVASYLGDAAILSKVLVDKPDVVGFSAYVWNIQRVRYLARRLKESYAPQIVLGGPEVTPDNPLLNDPHIDHCVHGPGEAAFAQFLEMTGLAKRSAVAPPDSFQRSPSPYLSVPLEHEIEGMMLLETTRGCPYHCAYCYYNKASESPAFKDERHVLEAVSWAHERDVEEIYFLDPSLNVRPDLKTLLSKVAARNPDRRLSLSSEIRAESVDAELAGRLAAAGFKSLEIGLQTTTSEALVRMRRPTDLKRFTEGVAHLKRQGILCRLDLIIGLPGDTPAGFDRTVRFVRENHFDDDIQVFPLFILPGTEFRRKHRSLGISYDPEPPYLVTRSPGFTDLQMLSAFEQAENAFDTALYPRPDLDAAWRLPGCASIEDARDIFVSIAGDNYAYKIMLHPHRRHDELRRLAERVTHPYQIIFPPTAVDVARQAETITLFSGYNPHTPFEVIFFDPQQPIQVATLLQAARLQQPHYLDHALRFADAFPGNRAIVFTKVGGVFGSFKGPAQRSVFWWCSESLPDMNALRRVESDGFEGILIDPRRVRDIRAWQNRMAPAAAELPLVSFAEPAMQRQWIALTARHVYYPAVLPG